jgi:hypothetical protein
MCILVAATTPITNKTKVELIVAVAVEGETIKSTTVAAKSPLCNP